MEVYVIEEYEQETDEDAANNTESHLAGGGQGNH